MRWLQDPNQIKVDKPKKQEVKLVGISEKNNM
jgi:hypothetical protein